MKYIIALTLLLGLAVALPAAEKGSSKKKSAETAKAPEKAPTKAEMAAKSLTTAQRTKLLKLVNEGDDKALQAIPGVGETRAAAIKKARPIKEVADLMNVEGIGEEIYGEIIKYAKSGASEEEKKSDSGKSKKKSGAKKK